MNKGILISCFLLIAAIFIITSVTSAVAFQNGVASASLLSSIKNLIGMAPAVNTVTLNATGNGAPSGSHYNLNIIGVSKEKNPDFTGGDGHRIFVSLGEKKPADPITTKILLSQSTDGTFQVLDANGTDGQAKFQLPVPGTYSIWARPVGKPGGSSQVTTCAIDPVTLEEVCSTANEVFIRNTGKSSFRDVTVTLTTIDLDPSLTEVIDACDGATTVSLFNPCLEGYFWAYDNNGLKILQLRFYPVVTVQ